MPLAFKTPFRYIGGKSYIAKWIVDHLPQHRCYVEVFGGTGAVLFEKGLSPYEIFNDLDDDVYLFFHALRYATDDLIEFLEACPYSRKLFEKWAKADVTKMDAIERAGRFFLLTTLSFSGIPGKWSFPIRSGFRRDQDYRNIGETQTYVRKIEALKDFAKRLQNVTIEHLDCNEVIDRYDSPIACFYCDPPYLDKDLYGIPFPWKKHLSLSKVLNNIYGKAIISYYPHPDLEDFYPPDKWHYVERVVTKQAGKGKSLKDRQVKELLIMNYDPLVDKFRDKDQTAIDSFWK